MANLQFNEKIEIAELDEIKAYIQQKTTDEFGLLRIGLEKNHQLCLRRQINKNLWESLNDKEVNGFCSDYRKSHSELILEGKHTQVEGRNVYSRRL